MGEDERSSGTVRQIIYGLLRLSRLLVVRQDVREPQWNDA